MSISTGHAIFVSAILVDFAGIFIMFGACLHLAYTRTDELLEHLKNCSAVMRRAPLRYGGPWGKLFLIGGISGIVTFPGVYLKHGGVSITDINNLPTSLRRRLAVIQWSLIVLMAVMFGLAIYGKLIK